MMTNNDDQPRSSLESQPTDPGLAERVAELADRIARGEPLDLDSLRRDEPGLVDRLAAMLPAIEFLARMGKSSPGELSSIAAVLPRDDSEEGIGRLGDFLLIQEIGRGGMGIVFEAIQLSLGRRVALKVLPQLAALDQTRRLRFEAEAHAAASLDHEHIVRVFAVGEDRGLPHFAMPLIAGVSLARVLHHLRFPEAAEATGGGLVREVVGWFNRGPGAGGGEGSVPLRTSTSGDNLLGVAPISARPGPAHSQSAAILGLQASEALAHAHARGVLHRDIKPGNLIVDRRGKLWIADFGLARLPGSSSLTATGDLVGTLRYMSPEQVSSQTGAVDPRTDLYGLGVTLYELLTLEPAFQPDEPNRLARRICGEEPTPIRSLNPAVPIDLETIVAKAMSKDPTERYDNASSLAEDLRRFLEDRPILARRPSAIDLLAKWGVRHRNGVMLALTALFFATLGLTVAIVLIAREHASTVAALTEVAARKREVEAAQKVADGARKDALESAEETRRSNHRLREMLYVSNMRHANEARLDQAPLLMNEYLNRHVPGDGEEDLRDFVWYFLRASGRVDSSTIDEVEEPLYDAKFSPDGRSLAVAGADGIVRLYEQPGDRLLQAIETGQGEVNDMEFAPDGTTLATAGDDGTIRLWDRATGGELWSRQAVDDGLAMQVRFLRGGGLLASSGHEPVVRLWGPSDGSPVGELPSPGDDPYNPNIHMLAASSDGRYLAVTGPGEHIKLYDFNEDPASPVWESMTSFQSPARSVALSRDGSLLVCTSRRYLTVHVWSDNRIIHDAWFEDEIQGLAFLDDERVLAISDRAGKIHLHPISRDGDPSGDRRSWVAHQGRLYALAASPKGRELVSAGVDGRVRRWSPFRPGQGWTIVEDGHIWDAELGPGGDSLVTLRNSRERIRTRRAGCDWVDFRDLDSGGIDRSIPLPAQACAVYQDVCVSASGRFLLATMMRDHWYRSSSIPFPQPRLVAFDLTTNRLRFSWMRPEGYVPRAIASSHGGDTMAVCLTRRVVEPNKPKTQVIVYDLDGFTKAQIIPLHHPDSPATERLLEYAPGDRLLAIGAGNEIFLFDPASGEELGRLKAHSSTVRALTFSPDSRLLASVGSSRRLIVQALDSGAIVFDVLAHPHEVQAVTFSPDGRLIATRSTEGPIRIWHLTTRQLVLELTLPNQPEHQAGQAAVTNYTLDFTPDGRRLLVHHWGAVQILGAPPAGPERGRQLK